MTELPLTALGAEIDANEHERPPGERDPWHTGARLPMRRHAPALWIRSSQTSTWSGGDAVRREPPVYGTGVRAQGAIRGTAPARNIQGAGPTSPGSIRGERSRFITVMTAARRGDWERGVPAAPWYGGRGQAGSRAAQANACRRKARPSAASASCEGASERQMAAARAIVWLSGVNDSITSAPS